MAATRDRVGRPTQFHGVPLEERAFDSQGNRLPWALEWADDHPNARHQKKQPEEKGSFGKSTRRKGSSRTSRTQTPAKKENPTLDGFEAALKFDTQKETTQKPSISGSGLSDAVHSSGLALEKEPTQIMLYGYSPEMQWAALEFYETVSGGMICEDYEREPPPEKRRYQAGLGKSARVSQRTLTKEERTLAMKYRGGLCWIKVTFDSREAADLAVYNSPHLLHGHWVHAAPFRGEGPERDEPIVVRDEDREQGLLGAPKPSQTTANLLPSSQLTRLQREHNLSKTSLTPHRSTFATSPLVPKEHLLDSQSATSTTVSSGTVGVSETTRIRKRASPDDEISAANPTFTHFPTTARTALRPASEALLPQLSWSERLLKQLSKGGWIPKDIIGSVVPHLENGEFDWNSSSFYWRICYWFDLYLGTDLCGMRDS